MTKVFTKGLLCTSALAILTACGGSSTGGGVSIDSAEAGRQLFAADFGDLAAALEAGETVSARAVGTSALQRDYENQSSSLLDDVLVQVSKNSAGELSLIINGEEVAFATGDRFIENDGRVFGYEQDGSNFYYNLFSWNGELDELISEDGPVARPVAFYFETPDSSTASQGYAILGTETGPDNLPTTGSANLEGYSVVAIFPEENLTSFGSSRERLRSDVTMTVDFANNMISGEMTNLEAQDTPDNGNGRADLAGTIIMEDATFNANGYSGNLTLDDAALASTELSNANLGTYSGTFYGDEGQATAGTITSTFENENGSYNAYGFFVAD